jgi:hypothetical protein
MSMTILLEHDNSMNDGQFFIYAFIKQIINRNQNAFVFKVMLRLLTIIIVYLVIS